jgi:hypothetical protein
MDETARGEVENLDFVTELTSEVKLVVDESDEEELPSRHPFFQKVNVRNIRKAHRNICDNIFWIDLTNSDT